MSANRRYSGRLCVAGLFLLVLVPCAWAQPNILVVVADDLGVDQVGFSGVAQDPVPTPNLDALASRGLVLTNFWTAGLCTPSRAMLMSGKQAHLTGVGFNDRGWVVPGSGLALSETVIPEVLGPSYQTAIFGKWHVSASVTSAADQGFDYHTLSYVLDNPDWRDAGYTSWAERTQGELSYHTGFWSDSMFQAAEDWIAAQTEPWFAVVADFLPHRPWVCPPADQIDGAPCSAATPDRARFRLMVRAHDSLVGRLVDSLPPNTIVWWLADNGTDRAMSQPPVPYRRAKGTTWQGGVWVPSIVAGPGVRPGVESAPISVDSVLATVAEWAGMSAPADVGPSQAVCFATGAGCGGGIIASQLWLPHHSPFPPNMGSVVVRDARYKMFGSVEAPPMMFDLQSDPWEQTALGRSAAPQAWDELVAALVAIRSEWLAQ